MYCECTIASVFLNHFVVYIFKFLQFNIISFYYHETTHRHNNFYKYNYISNKYTNNLNDDRASYQSIQCISIPIRFQCAYKSLKTSPSPFIHLIGTHDMFIPSNFILCVNLGQTTG